jgi:hypothetical protein
LQVFGVVGHDDERDRDDGSCGSGEMRVCGDFERPNGNL